MRGVVGDATARASVLRRFFFLVFGYTLIRIDSVPTQADLHRLGPNRVILAKTIKQADLGRNRPIQAVPAPIPANLGQNSSKKKKKKKRCKTHRLNLSFKQKTLNSLIHSFSHSLLSVSPLS